MYYAIHHITRFRYNTPVNESVMEVRMQPLSEGAQRCLFFQLNTTPRAQVRSHVDTLGNTVHFFTVPGKHSLLSLAAEALVEVHQPPALPAMLASDAWQAIQAQVDEDYTAWEMTQPSQYARPSELLPQLATELQLEHAADPLALLHCITDGISRSFAYVPQSTRVDSPIEEILHTRQGVCQDFAHVMIALVRSFGIPCRYISGYLFHRREDHDRSEEDATHAWVEAWLPGMGWVGFDPTNNLVAGERHVRTAVGRDYADVPPTRGVYKGGATSELFVSVRVTPSVAPPPRILPTAPEPVTEDWQPQPAPEAEQQQSQQQ